MLMPEYKKEQAIDLNEPWGTGGAWGRSTCMAPFTMLPTRPQVRHGVFRQEGRATISSRSRCLKTEHEDIKQRSYDMVLSTPLGALVLDTRGRRGGVTDPSIIRTLLTRVT